MHICVYMRNSRKTKSRPACVYMWMYMRLEAIQARRDYNLYVCAYVRMSECICMNAYVDVRVDVPQAVNQEQPCVPHTHINVRSYMYTFICTPTAAWHIRFCTPQDIRDSFSGKSSHYDVGQYKHKHIHAHIHACIHIQIRSHITTLKFRIPQSVCQGQLHE
jgi:hypothetical protein